MRLALSISLITISLGFALVASAEADNHTDRTTQSMIPNSNQPASLTQAQFEAAVVEAEALYDRNESAKAATLLIGLMERAPNNGLRELLALVLFDYPLPPELVPRLARAANGSELILSQLLQRSAELPADIVRDITTLQNEAQKAWVAETKTLRELEAQYERSDPTPAAQLRLVELIETTRNDQIREHAVQVLCRRPVLPKLALRAARAAGKTEGLPALLSETAALPPDAVRELMTLIVLNGDLDTSAQYGQAAKRGVIPDDFVPSIFGRASEDVHNALLTLAVNQLQARGDERLHLFLVNVMFGDYSWTTRDRAGGWLGVVYQENSALSRGRFRIDQAAIQRFFGAVPEFTSRLLSVLRDPRLIEQHSVLAHLTYAFAQADASVAGAFFANEAATYELVRQLLSSIARNHYPAELREAMLKFVRIIGAHGRWSTEVATALFTIAGRENDEALLDAAVDALAVVPGPIDLAQADPKQAGTLGDRLADRVGQMVSTSPAVMLKLAREFHKIVINDQARQRVLAQLLAVAGARQDSGAQAAVMRLVPSTVAHPILAYNLACTSARQNDRDAMLKYAERALALGRLPAQFRADADFAPYLQDKQFLELLDAVR